MAYSHWTMLDNSKHKTLKESLIAVEIVFFGVGVTKHATEGYDSDTLKRCGKEVISHSPNGLRINNCWARL